MYISAFSFHIFPLNAAPHWPCIHHGNKSARSSWHYCVWQWSTVNERTSTTVFTIAVNLSTGNQQPFFDAQCEAGARAHCSSMTTITLRRQMSWMKHNRMTHIEGSLHYTQTRHCCPRTLTAIIRPSTSLRVARATRLQLCSAAAADSSCRWFSLLHFITYGDCTKWSSTVKRCTCLRFLRPW